MTEVSTGRRAAFRFVFLSALMSAISFSIVHPILPALVRKGTGGDIASAAEWMMAFASAWGLAQFVCSPVLGALSDRYGRRPVLLISLFGLGVDLVFMAFAPSVAWLLVGRTVSGATGGAFGTLHAYVADVTEPDERAAAFGKLASSISIGFMVGPALGGWLGEIDLGLPFVAAAAVTLANVLYGLFVLPESLAAAKRTATLTWKRAHVLGSLRFLGARPDLVRLAAISFLAQLANMIWGSVFVLYAAYRFGWSPLEMGLSMVASGLAGVGVQAWVVGRSVKRFGERGSLLIGLVLSGLALVYAAWCPNGWWYVAAIPVFAFGLLLGPGLQGLLSSGVGEDEQGRLQGATQSLNGIAVIAGPPIFGASFAWALRQKGDLDLSGLPLLIGAAIFGAALAIALTLSSASRGSIEPARRSSVPSGR